MNRPPGHAPYLLVLAFGAAACAPQASSTDSASTRDRVRDLQGRNPTGAADGWFTWDGQIVCPEFVDAEPVSEVQVDRAEELSGLTASLTNPNIFWSHNDSGTGRHLIAFNTEGVHHGDFKLVDAKHTDWEDVALGPGPNPFRDYIYVADIGDNDLERGKVRVYRTEEPIISGPSDKTTDVEEYETFRFEYDDGDPHDAEAIAVDPSTGDIYVATKAQSGDRDTLIFMAEPPFEDGETHELVKVLDEDDLDELKGQVTGADISADGRRFILKFDDQVSVWYRRNEPYFWHALEREPCVGPVAPGQQETVAWSPWRTGYYMVPEGKTPDLYFVAAR